MSHLMHVVVPILLYLVKQLPGLLVGIAVTVIPLFILRSVVPDRKAQSRVLIPFKDGSHDQSKEKFGGDTRRCVAYKLGQFMKAMTW
jgi:hypothetical protein